MQTLHRQLIYCTSVNQRSILSSTYPPPWAGGGRFGPTHSKIRHTPNHFSPWSPEEWRLCTSARFCCTWSVTALSQVMAIPRRTRTSRRNYHTLQRSRLISASVSATTANDLEPHYELLFAIIKVKIYKETSYCIFQKSLNLPYFVLKHQYVLFKKSKYLPCCNSQTRHF